MSLLSRIILACALLGAAAGFAVQPSAFASAPVLRSSASCARPAAGVSMACRTNTKREKFFRNLAVSGGPPPGQRLAPAAPASRRATHRRTDGCRSHSRGPLRPPPPAQNAKRFRKASYRPAFKGRGPQRGGPSETPESKEDAALMATIYVTTDQSGEAIASKPEPALAA